MGGQVALGDGEGEGSTSAPSEAGGLTRAERRDSLRRIMERREMGAGGVAGSMRAPAKFCERRRRVSVCAEMEGKKDVATHQHILLRRLHDTLPHPIHHSPLQLLLLLLPHLARGARLTPLHPFPFPLRTRRSGTLATRSRREEGRCPRFGDGEGRVLSEEGGDEGVLGLGIVGEDEGG